MGLRIEPSGTADLALFGDVEAVIALPARCRDGRFSLAFSDGTLVRARHHAASRRCVFEVAVAGASRIKIDASSGVDALLFDGRIDWMLLGAESELHCFDDAAISADQSCFDLSAAHNAAVRAVAPADRAAG